MRFALPVLLILLCACANTPKRHPAQRAGAALKDIEIESYAQAAASLLRPRLFRLDRPAITFYYEEMSTSGEIRSLEEASARLLTKPDRFTGSRTGLYSEADPKGSRGFGKDRPRLFVLRIAAGTLFLNDTHPTETERARFIAALHLDPGAAEEYSAIHYLGHIDADSASIFRIENRVLELLGTDNRLYHFNEAAQKDCRYNGTDLALRLTDPRAFTTIAYFSENEIVAPSSIAAHIKRLFDETSLLNFDSLARLPRKLLQEAEQTVLSENEYKRWKDQFILTCGARWAFE